MYKNFADVKEALRNSSALDYLGALPDRPCNHQLHLFQNESRKYVLKELKVGESEIDAYMHYLPRATQRFGPFESFILPQFVECFETSEFIYLLLPYYEGEVFGDIIDNLSLAEGMIKIITELWNVDCKALISDGSILDFFDFERIESTAWSFLDQAFAAELLDRSKEHIIRQQVKKILLAGRTTQQPFFSNGDFVTRNIVLQADGKFVLLDWPSVFWLLEATLVDPWLLNIRQKAWRDHYAHLFEKTLPVRPVNINYHLMRQSIARAILAFDAYQKGDKGALAAVEESLMYFHRSLDGMNSLIGMG